MLILFEGKIYRPAGCRLPAFGEQYVNKEGKVVVKQRSHIVDGTRLIVRELLVDDQKLIDA